MLAVFGVLADIWKHRTGKLARGIGAAGAEYNDLYGQGGPPQTPEIHGSVGPDDRD
jgi:hypothetical protein